MLYLDHAATSPVRPEVLEAMQPSLTGVFGNPSSHHTAGEAAASALDDARARVARVLGMRAGDIVFTAGGTEANNLAVKGIVLAALDSGRRHLVISPIEHESILESAEYLRRFHAVEVTTLPVDPRGRIAPDALSAAIREDTALVSIGHANNEIGTVQDAAALAAVTRAARVPLHLDAVQSAGWLALNALGADAVSIAGHKLGAPKGIGALAVRGRVPVEPVLHGGGQERGRRSGTENVAGAVALATALELADRERETVSSLVGSTTARFITLVLDGVPDAALTGDRDHRLPATASFTFAGTSGESVLLELERRGVISSSGSACAAGSDDPSHVLLACGVPAEVAQTAVRFSFGREALPTDAPERLAALVAESVRAARG
ncbi:MULTISPECIES: cysteine desulfurase family protein [unclassified Microbacterium]|uniref:cysteine desulfurase family protein n=1 Tax=unclassified Microbacterium TaxID=2609290 RepID=UPI0016053754|nr:MULTISPECIES: cysteine desulfurase family protein [unclassified Microbacterium]QNA92218.1 cysteine desulfurase [Microbacterium sp. Se63.02b]QYM65484.1 cysteine desulfurase [Microbacterium sp. Se5.02b]